MAWTQINYREFWDVPRVFFAAHNGRDYLFECPFDEKLDDYPDAYRVYEMPALTDAQLQGSWENLSNFALSFAGTVPVSGVRFDPTKRCSIDAAVFELMHAEPAGHARSA